jgi:hypothetical protein
MSWQLNIRALPHRFGEVLAQPGSSPSVEEAEELVKRKGMQYVEQLKDRVQQEMPSLPFGR